METLPMPLRHCWQLVDHERTFESYYRIGGALVVVDLASNDAGDYSYIQDKIYLGMGTFHSSTDFTPEMGDAWMVSTERKISQ